MKKRERGVNRLLKARQQLKNVAKELGIDLAEVFADAAVLKKKHEQMRGGETASPLPHKQATAGSTPAPAIQISAGLDESAVAGPPRPASGAEAPRQSGAPQFGVYRAMIVHEEGCQGDPCNCTLHTNIYNEPMRPVEPPKEFGATGIRRAEPNPIYPEGSPYYVGRCVGCNGEMLTRGPLEDICETCGVALRDDSVQLHEQMISQAAGQLVDPFKGGDF